MKPKTVAALLLLLAPLPTFAGTLTGPVVKIADGDTLTALVAGNEQKRIRLSEIDTPERGQPWSRKAKEALTDTVTGETVSVEVVTTERYGRTMGKVWLDGRDINRELVAEGHAWVYRKYMIDENLLEDQQSARKGSRGYGSCRRPLWELGYAQRRKQRRGFGVKVQTRSGSQCQSSFLRMPNGSCALTLARPSNAIA